MDERRTVRRMLRGAVAALLLVTAAAGVSATAQQTKVPAEIVTRVFKLAHADVRDVATVIQVFGGRVVPQPDLGVLVWSGPAELLPGIETAVHNLDTPPVAARSLELTFHLLAAQPAAAGGRELPDDLAGVATQLRKVLSLPAVRLLDTAVLRLRDGSRNKAVSGILPGDRGSAARYAIRCREVTLVSSQDEHRIRISGLDLSVQVPVPGAADAEGEKSAVQTIGFDTDVDLRPGQKVVVGKTSAAGFSDTLVLLVMGSIVE